MGGRDYFSNGIHLNVIEAAENPAEESWRNLNAITDLVREIIETDSHLVISALRGDAAAGGVALALAADHVVGREDIVLNPYYQHMGGLYGSEYWTYLLPRRIGAEMTATLINPPFTPIGAHEQYGSACWTPPSAPRWTALTTTPATWPNGSPPIPTCSTGWRNSASGVHATSGRSLCRCTAPKS